MTEFHRTVVLARRMGRDAAKEMLTEISQEAAETYWRDNANAESAHAYGFWSGFLNVLAERR